MGKIEFKVNDIFTSVFDLETFTIVNIFEDNDNKYMITKYFDIKKRKWVYEVCDYKGMQYAFETDFYTIKK